MTKDSIADKILAAYPLQPSDPDLPNASQLASRQILVVKNYMMISASSVPAGGGDVTCQPIIRCDGTPSPSSKVTHGFIRFAPEARLQPPQYRDTAKEIHLWFAYEAIPQVLDQLAHPNRYLWVGFFNGGHIYGDLHSAF
ncbi:hypothetical protein [Roseovarius sp. E0-M6]|uniref:hypothetical protein n=1 Tax=Roseovarius sp. E0-M6 TaxID=3127118 RepID=UPI00301016A2